MGGSIEIAVKIQFQYCFRIYSKKARLRGCGACRENPEYIAKKSNFNTNLANILTFFSQNIVKIALFVSNAYQGNASTDQILVTNSGLLLRQA